MTSDVLPDLRRLIREEVQSLRSAELAVVHISEIVPVKSSELVGPRPDGVQLVTVFAAALSHNAPAPEAAQELIRFLASAGASRVIKANGMEPG